MTIYPTVSVLPPRVPHSAEFPQNRHRVNTSTSSGSGSGLGSGGFSGSSSSSSTASTHTMNATDSMSSSMNAFNTADAFDACTGVGGGVVSRSTFDCALCYQAEDSMAVPSTPRGDRNGATSPPGGASAAVEAVEAAATPPVAGEHTSGTDRPTRHTNTVTPVAAVRHVRRTAHSNGAHSQHQHQHQPQPLQYNFPNADTLAAEAEAASASVAVFSTTAPLTAPV